VLLLSGDAVGPALAAQGSADNHHRHLVYDSGLEGLWLAGGIDWELRLMISDKRRTDLAKIHIAKKELGLADEEYRDILYTNFRVSSAKDLGGNDVVRLLHIFKQKGWRPRPGRKARNYKKIKGPLARQKRYILALWNALGYDLAKLDARCKRQFKIDRFEWLQDEDQLCILITDLRARCERVGLDPSPH